MELRHVGLIALVIVFVQLPIGARSADMRRKNAVPSAIVVIEERGIALLVRLDRPVDHSRSSLALVRDSRVIGRPRPRLEAAPNVLFARVAMPTPGNYALRWKALAGWGIPVACGETPFTVASGR